MATQAGVPTVLGNGNAALDVWSGPTLLGAFTKVAHTPLTNPLGSLATGVVPTVLGANVLPLDQWAGAIQPYTTLMRWQGFGWHYLFNATTSNPPDNQPIDMLPLRGWIFDVPRRNTLIPQAPDSQTRFPAAS